MLDINYVRTNKEELKQNILNRQLDPKKFNVDELLQLDLDKKFLIQKVEALRKKRNEITQQINKTTESEREELIKTAKSIRKELKKEEEKSEKILLRWRELMDLMPNVTNSNMPVGKDDSGNVEIKS